MLERHSPGPDQDMQQLLQNLDAHGVALQLLQHPYVHEEVRPGEERRRAVLRMAYRLLNAMASGFVQMQARLARCLPIFISHTGSNLFAADISPTDLIITICKDNRAACLQAVSLTHAFRERRCPHGASPGAGRWRPCSRCPLPLLPGDSSVNPLGRWTPRRSNALLASPRQSGCPGTSASCARSSVLRAARYAATRCR